MRRFAWWSIEQLRGGGELAKDISGAPPGHSFFNGLADGGWRVLLEVEHLVGVRDERVGVAEIPPQSGSREDGSRARSRAFISRIFLGNPWSAEL